MVLPICSTIRTEHSRLSNEEIEMFDGLQELGVLCIPRDFLMSYFPQLIQDVAI